MQHDLLTTGNFNEVQHLAGIRAGHLHSLIGVEHARHPAAKDDQKIYQYNYEATKLSIERAMKNEPKVSEITSKKDTVKHPIFEK